MKASIFSTVYLLWAIFEASKIVEYKFGINFGQVFYDYSDSFNHGQNGQNISTTTSDTIPTDRGAYFTSSFNSYIKLPPNEKVSSSLSIGSIFSQII
jgi:hypothetical protein